MSRCLIKSSAILLGLSAAVAAHSTDDPCGAHDCASLNSDSDRLACYDKAFGGPAQAGGAVDAGAARAVEARRDFGLSESDKRARDPEAAKVLLPGKLEATVTDVRRDATGKLIITLDNGQVWMQSEAIAQARLSTGDAVVIRKAALGSYQLVTPGRVAIRVRRVQ